MTPKMALRVVMVSVLGWSLIAGALPATDLIQTLDGRTISPQQPEAEFAGKQEAFLREALAQRTAQPENADAWVWVGRRQAYLGRYLEAVTTYDEALERFPEDARFLRHRGHRNITLRRLDEAVADLSQAAEMVAGLVDQVEPDGLPNALGIPTSSLQTNIWYHLGLALYLQGDFIGAAKAYGHCRRLSTNPDMEVAASYWLYLSLRRAGDDADAHEVLAGISPDLELIENDGYYDLLLLFASGGDGAGLMHGASDDKGAVAFPTTAYGVGVWHHINGRNDRALRVFEAILASPAVSAFGYIAAEAEAARAARR